MTTTDRLSTPPPSRQSWWSESALSVTPSEATLRSPFFAVQPARTMRAAGFDWDHEIRVAQTLSIRGYPTLRMQARIFPGESHDTVLPHVLSWGVRSVWSDRLASRRAGADPGAGQ